MAHSSKGRNALTNAKPFCDCGQCASKKCPNVLEKLGVNLEDTPSATEKKVVRKTAKKKQIPTEPEESERTPSLLGILNPNRLCNCDVVAKALNNDIHNIGTLVKRGNHENEAMHSKDLEDPECTKRTE